MEFFRGSILDFSKRQNVIFWISQVFVVLSTVIGVFLATNEGLKSAVEFHSATSLEKKYYTLSALHEEVASNNQLILNTLEKNFNVKPDGSYYASYNTLKMPDLNWFVWVTMSNSTETLDLPVTILRDANRYYINLTNALAKLQSSRGREVLRDGWALKQLTEAANTGIISDMQKQISRYQTRLESYQLLGNY